MEDFQVCARQNVSRENLVGTERVVILARPIKLIKETNPSPSTSLSQLLVLVISATSRYIPVHSFHSLCQADSSVNEFKNCKKEDGFALSISSSSSSSSKMSEHLPRLPVARLTGHDGPVQAMVFTPDGKWCLTGGLDRTVKLWNPFRVDPQYSGAVSNTAETTSNPFSRKQRNNHTAFQELPPALNIQTYTKGFTHDISALCLANAPGNEGSQTLLAASNQSLVVTDLVSNRVQRKLGQSHHTGRINAVASANHGEAYLTASYDATVAIWDGRSKDYKPIQILKEAKDSVTSVLVRQQTGDQKHDNMAVIHTASVDGKVRTYDLRKGQLQSDDVGSPITSMAVTKDGNCLVVSCLDGTIRLMEIATGELLNTYEGHHTAGQYGLGVDVLANDATVLSGSENGECALYDLVRADSVKILEGPARRPTCAVAAHPKQSSVVIAASYDNSTVVWSHEDAPWQEQLLSDT